MSPCPEAARRSLIRAISLSDYVTKQNLRDFQKDFPTVQNQSRQWVIAARIVRQKLESYKRSHFHNDIMKQMLESKVDAITYPPQFLCKARSNAHPLSKTKNPRIPNGL
ncbi:hypothetical protein SLE2022_059590 [Rubroshorea leprosula]